MCLSIPYKIKKINGQKAIVDNYDQQEREVNVELIGNLKIGDWILSLNNFATQKISAKEAEEIIKLFNYE
ncbi:MAG: HypC/HybG/HupF family hydrogenase formation chaperone [Candidatus Buchananbacteria bacterium]|nr:HypC/HybG/HupF family hydrogenase formation chaperone [Candidatus Buchananbacteria bacterium]